MSFSSQIGLLAHDCGILCVLIPLCIALFLFFQIVRIVWTLVMGQFFSIWKLYTEWETESLDDFHPYTRSILTNHCPELALIATFKRQPQTRQVKEKLHGVIQSMIDMLEENETMPVKYAIIEQLKAI